MSQADPAWRRVLYDANVWVSSAAFPASVPSAAIDRARSGYILSMTSEALIDQVRRALLGPKFALSLAMVDAAERERRGLSLIIHPAIRQSVISTKASDNRVLECAIAGGADVIVTGDRKHLLRLERYQGIPIISPRDFVESFVEES